MFHHSSPSRGDQRLRQPQWLPKLYFAVLLPCTKSTSPTPAPVSWALAHTLDAPGPRSSGLPKRDQQVDVGGEERLGRF